MVGIRYLHSTYQVFSEHLEEQNRRNRKYIYFMLLTLDTQQSQTFMTKKVLTSAGFFGLEAVIPGLLPYLLEEQKEVEGPQRKQN